MNQHHPSMPSLAVLEHFWARGLISNDELLGCLLRHLVQLEQGQTGPATVVRLEAWEDHPANAPAASSAPAVRTPHGSTQQIQSLALNALRQIGKIVDGLTGQPFELWQANGLWYWRWDDTGEQSRHGLPTCGKALVDAIQRRAGLLPNPELPGEAASA